MKHLSALLVIARSTHSACSGIKLHLLLVTTRVFNRPKSKASGGIDPERDVFPIEKCSSLFRFSG